MRFSFAREWKLCETSGFISSSSKDNDFSPPSPKDALSGNDLNHSEKFVYCSTFVFFLKYEETMQLEKKKKKQLRRSKVNWYVSNKSTIELKS